MIKEKYSGEIIDNLINFFKLNVKGILHVGAHKCEELDVYLKYTDSNSIYWIEAIEYLVKQNLDNIPNLNIINEVIGDKDGVEVEFKITNNTLSSSILELGEHKDLHPNVIVTDVLKLKTKTLETIFNENSLHGKFNTLVLDLQGAEMLALKGLKDIINEFDIIYTEVNEKEIYKECCILEDLDLYLNQYNFERKYLNTLNNYGNALYIRKH
jgi:FkbM family methyltransferase